LAKAEATKRGYGPLTHIFSFVGSRDILLYNPDDGLRGAMSFYRNRTAQEIRSPEQLMKRLMQNQDSTVAMYLHKDRTFIPPELNKAALESGTGLKIITSFHFLDDYLIVISAGPENEVQGDRKRPCPLPWQQLCQPLGRK